MSDSTTRQARDDLSNWMAELQKGCYEIDTDFCHSIKLYHPEIDKELIDFGRRVAQELEPLVARNCLPANWPSIEHYDGIGQQIERVVHHPDYETAGNIIYSSGLMERMANPGGLLPALCFLFLSAQTGEAGHNCPIACSAGLIRALKRVELIPHTDFYLKKLTEPSYSGNYTGAQFVTEVQGGSDVGANATRAQQDKNGNWRITGEKWFCSNANADLILLTARFDEKLKGTKGLGLFLVPAYLDSGERNSYVMRRLKDKIGTHSMASAEMDFHHAFAIAVGDPAGGFKLMMENVLHISRICNTFCTLGMARRAYWIARFYAAHRKAFGSPIDQYPLVQENLARIKAENTAALASIFAATRLQDEADKNGSDENLHLLRLLMNINKYISAKWSVTHIHHCLDVLAGNGAIESFSPIPRLLRDSIVCENWEGTHNALFMQILRDIHRYNVDELFFSHIGSRMPKMCKTLQKEMNIFKKETRDVQALQIRRIVDRMGRLYCAVCLEKEADLQEEGSKRLCLEYFIRPNNVLDEETLTLIRGVIT